MIYSKTWTLESIETYPKGECWVHKSGYTVEFFDYNDRAEWWVADEMGHDLCVDKTDNMLLFLRKIRDEYRYSKYGFATVTYAKRFVEEYVQKYG